MPVHLPTRVRFSDTDAVGHVNNARFLSYLEDARLALFAQLLDEGCALGRGVIVARVECDYVRQIHLSRTPIDVHVWVEKIGTKSLTLGYRIEQDGEVACRATTVIAAYDYDTGTTRALTDDERVALSRHLVDETR